MPYYGPERKNQRLKNYDYSEPGYYFVTFCTKGRIDYFGEIVDGKMVLNDYGEIILEGIMKTRDIRDEIEFDECIIMPNHIHMIIIVKNMDNNNPVGKAGMRSETTMRSEPQTNFETTMRFDKLDESSNERDSGPHACGPYVKNSNENGPYENEIMNKTKNYLSNTIQGLKAYITKEIRQKYTDYEFAWQKSFHDVIIRNQEQLDKTREYIILNPSKWEDDVNNLINIKPGNA